MKALLIVDVQNDFLPPHGSLAVKDGDHIISIINTLMDKFSLVIATKDWHPPTHQSFANQHGKQPGEKIQIEGGIQELWPVHCVQFSWGAEFSSDLHRHRISQVFYKGIDPFIDSYSAFFDNAHGRSTGLCEFLKSQGISEIFIAGLATDYCVKYSVQDALDLGLTVYVITDACKGINVSPGDVDRALEEMRKAGAHLIRSDEVTNRLA